MAVYCFLAGMAVVARPYLLVVLFSSLACVGALLIAARGLAATAKAH